MKAKFLKIAKCKTVKQFYDKYPTEKAFFEAHPEAKTSIKKAQIGAYIGGGANPNAEMINFQDVYDVAEKQAVGSTSSEREEAAYKQQMLEALKAKGGGGEGGAQSSGMDMGSVMGMMGGGEGGGIGGGSEGGGGLMEMLGGLFGGGGMRYGGNIPKAYGGTNVNNWWSNMTTTAQTTGAPGGFDINTYGIGAQTLPAATPSNRLPGTQGSYPGGGPQQGPPDTSNPNWMNRNNNSIPQEGAATPNMPSSSIPSSGTDDGIASKLGGLTKLAGPVGALIEGVDALKGEKEAAARAKQLRMLTDLQLTASQTRPEEKERRYVRPEDVVNTGEAFFPIYGVGTNALARNGIRLQGGGMIKGNPTEIQNTYGNGRSIYDDLGYVPLIDEDQDKNFRYGGYIPRAQNGMQNYMSTMGGGGSGFSGAGASGATPWGAIGSFGSQAANTVQGGGNAGGRIGGTVGGGIGAIFGPAGQAIGQVVGTVAGNELDPYAGPMKLDTAKTKRNVENIAYNKTAPEIQAAHEAHVRDGGKIPQAQRGKKIKIKDDRLDRQVTKDQLQDRNVFSQNQLSFKKPVVQKQMKQLRKDAANPKVVVFAESPKDKPTYDPYDSNLPEGLINLRDEYFDNENKIDSVRMADKTYKNFLDKATNSEDQAYDLQMKYGPDDPRVQKAYDKAMQINDQFNQYTIGNKAFNKKLKPYRDMADSSYVRFRDSELNPMAMDSTFYKEAQNVKDFYKRTDPNTKVDVVPLYGDDKLMQRKLRDMSQFDKFAIFGHSGGKLAGIKNNDIAKYLSNSRVEDCYFGSCGFESEIQHSDLKDMQGKNLNYRPSDNLWLGFNPAAKTFDEGMWSRNYNHQGKRITPINLGETHITNKLEDGGYMNPEYNPQVITMFGDHNAQDFADYAHKYRAGGHLQSYTPPSDRAMETYKDGGEVRRSALNGEVQTTWGGGIKTLSHNPYMPATGETIEFVGNSHDKYDPKSKQTGIGVKYGQGSQDSYTDYAEYGTDQADANVEVEKEPAAELIDPNTGEKNLTIYGNLRIPDKYVDLLGDPKAKGMKFKHYIANKSKEEDKINRMIDTSTDQLNALDVKTSGDRLTLAALEAKIKGGNMKLKDIADIKITSAGIQDAYNKTAEEYGIVADDLARGKVTFDKKATAEYARYGKSIPKAQDGKKEKFKSEKAALDAGYIKDNSGYYKILPPEKLDPIETKVAEAQKEIPLQHKDASGLYGGASAKLAQAQRNNPWFDFTGFNPASEADVKRFQSAFNQRAKSIGSSASLKEDGKFGDQTASALIDEKRKVQPSVGKRLEAEIEESPNTKPVPYKRSALIDIANQALDYIRPTDQEPFDYGQAMGEMYALSNNQVEPVQAQMYKPELRIPYDISYQDVLNENQADFNATIKQLGYNPAAQPMVNANKYMANQRVLADQFRANQAMKDQVYSGNINTLNQAKLANLDIFDKQYERQALAKSNTKATTQAALNSLDDKIAKHKLENKTLGIYKNLYKYRYDKNGRAINMNGIFQPNIGTVGSIAGTQKQVPIYGPDGKTITGYQLQEMTPEEIALQETNNSGAIPSLATLPINNNAKTKTTKNSRNGSIVKAIKNL